MSDFCGFQVRTRGVTADQVIDDYHQQFPVHGNDLDLLNQAMLLILAGHYRESLVVALRVQAPSTAAEELPATVDKRTAQRAFLSALARAQHLYAQTIDEVGDSATQSQMLAQLASVVDLLESSDEW